MKRSMMQAYVTRNDEAVALYQMAFDAVLISSYSNEDMVRKAYEILKTDAKILTPLAPCEFSSLMADLIDKYGIRWCLFV